MKKEIKVTDYHDFTTKETSAEDRARLGVGDLWVNAIKCRKCGDVIRSRNRHDYRSCSCGAVSVDGGSWYQRVVGDIASFESMLEPYDDVRSNELT